jgi:hypothetical protein
MSGLALGITSAAIGLGSVGIGLGNAGKARRAAAKAERESKQLMKEAERKAEKNFYEGVNVPLDAFNKQFEEQLQQQQQSLQALQEGDPRNLAAGVGRVGALAANQGEKTRIAMGEALYQNNKMKADAKQNVNQQLIDINLGGAADQSMMARDARRAESQGMQQAVDGIGAVAGAASDLVKPLSMNKADRRASKLLGSITAADKSKLNLQGLDDTAIIARLSQIPNIENMTRAELNVIMEQIKNEQFDFDFDLNKVFKPVSSVSSVSSSGVVPVSSGTGLSAPVYLGQ